MNRRLVGVLALALAALMVLACSAGTASLPDQGDPTSRDGQGEVPNDEPRGPATDADGDPDQAPTIPDQQLIVYTGSLDLEVADIDGAVSQAEQLIRGLGGNVASSQAADSGSGKAATVTYRVPAERWSEALAGMKALAVRVVNEDTSSEDVTAQVVDLDARLVNLRTTETALQSIMDRATTITDVLKVQDELTTVRGEIESLTAQRDLLAQRAALATLTVGFNVPVTATTEATGAWDLGAEIDSALAALVRLGQGAASLLVWLVIVVVPVVLPIAAVLLLAVWLRRRWVAAHPRPEVAGPPPPWTPSM